MPLLRILAGCGLLFGLTACEHYLPNSRPDQGSTEAITRAQSERLQASGPARVMPPSQLRFATGVRQAEDGECRDWLDPCWESGAGAAQSAHQESVPGLARLSRPAPVQTFRGMLPCADDTAGCQGQHAVLSLSEHRSWQARGVPVDQAGHTGAAVDMMGCWTRSPENPRLLRLYQADGALLSELEAVSSNSLLVRGPGDSLTTLRYTLTRQPEADSRLPAPSLVCPAT